MMTIIELAKQLVEKYEQQYKEWCLANPGYIMHNASIRKMCLDRIINGNMSIDEVKEHEFECREKGEKMTGPHGWWVSAETCKNLVDMYESQTKIIDPENPEVKEKFRITKAAQEKNLQLKRLDPETGKKIIDI